MTLTISKCLINVFLNFKGNSDIERYQMANKKIPFKYARPVEEWLQEKGNFKQTCFSAYVCLLHCSSIIRGLNVSLCIKFKA